jgi:predicted acetyltransferase
MQCPVTVSVVPAAPETRDTLVRLVQLYLHDLSAVEGWDVDETGSFGEELLRGCWTDARRHPFVIRADARVAGFALVDRGSHLTGDPTVYDMAEFFILRRWRRCGVGRVAVRHLTQLFAGEWEIRPFHGYGPAMSFWSTVCTELAVDGVSHDSYDRSGDRATVLKLRTQA